MKEKGVIIIVTFLIMGILMILGIYFLSLALAESKISKIQEVAVRSYYLAESGVNEAIWKLKNDETDIDGDVPWKICFTTSSVASGCPDCVNWSSTFTRNYSPDSTTTVSIINSNCARGEITATSEISFSSGKTSQRVIRIKVLKSLGSLSADSPVFSGSPSGEITINFSRINIYNGNLFSNNNINIKNSSIVKIYDNQASPDQEGKTLARSNINRDINSLLYASGTCSSDECTICNPFPGECLGYCDPIEDCPPDYVDMPAIDFDSASSYSYKSKAVQAQNEGQCSVKDSIGNLISSDCVFTEGEFEDLLWQVGEGGSLILEHKSNGNATSTYYVEGGIDLKGGRSLEVNGVLIADKTIDIGEKYSWKGDGGFSQIKINDPGFGIPSGLLTKSKINFGLFSSFQDINITGLIYSQDEIRLVGIPNNFNLTGGAMARKFSLMSCNSPLNFYLDNEVVREGVWGGSMPPPGGGIPYSPVITVEHWEESY